MTRLNDLFPSRPSSEAETRALGRSLAERLGAGDVVALYGDLGAGKTVLTKGIGAGLGIDPESVNSPSFTILNEYVPGTLPLYHFDAYRIERVEEFFDLGYEEYFYGDGVCVVEWAEKVERLLPPDALRIRMEHEEGDRRRVDLLDA